MDEKHNATGAQVLRGDKERVVGVIKTFQKFPETDTSFTDIDNALMFNG